MGRPAAVSGRSPGSAGRPIRATRTGDAVMPMSASRPGRGVARAAGPTPGLQGACGARHRVRARAPGRGWGQGTRKAARAALTASLTVVGPPKTKIAPGSRASSVPTLEGGIGVVVETSTIGPSSSPAKAAAPSASGKFTPVVTEGGADRRAPGLVEPVVGGRDERRRLVTVGPAEAEDLAGVVAEVAVGKRGTHGLIDAPGAAQDGDVRGRQSVELGLGRGGDRGERHEQDRAPRCARRAGRPRARRGRWPRWRG